MAPYTDGTETVMDALNTHTGKFATIAFVAILCLRSTKFDLYIYLHAIVDFTQS